jgi:excisionase family DNA binding protein
VAVPGLVSGAVFGLFWKVFYGSSWTSAVVVGALFGVLMAVARVLRNAITGRVERRQALVKGQGSEEWISVEEIAQRLGVKEDWVWMMAGRGEIAYVKIEHGLLGMFAISRGFRRPEVEAWMRTSAKDAPAKCHPRFEVSRRITGDDH